mmetsp:Transcript_55696/g.129879  ORF Transcript_55696/g.129879 Transcript_55696/m.129879 type:complete len:209 (-) Transcript_55696:252-878(-)
MALKFSLFLLLLASPAIADISTNTSQAAGSERMAWQNGTSWRYNPYVFPHAGQMCEARCRDRGFCCGSSMSANQMISCAQACHMRATGSPESDLIGSHGLCQRTSSSGCSLDVNGHSYTFCGVCSDVSDKCPHGVEDTVACQYGARAWTAYLMESHTIKNSNGCDCSWLYGDNCKDQSFCAVACRKANPWGTCGGWNLQLPMVAAVFP